jgi:hypothetical protein
MLSSSGCEPDFNRKAVTVAANATLDLNSSGCEPDFNRKAPGSPPGAARGTGESKEDQSREGVG